MGSEGGMEAHESDCAMAVNFRHGCTCRVGSEGEKFSRVEAIQARMDGGWELRCGKFPVTTTDLKKLDRASLEGMAIQINAAAEKWAEEKVKKAVEAARKCDSCGGTDLVCYGGHEDTVKKLRDEKDKAVREAVKMTEAYNEDLKRRLVEAKKAQDAVWEEAAKIAEDFHRPDHGGDYDDHHAGLRIAAALRARKASIEKG